MISPTVLNPHGTENPHGTANTLYRVKYERGWGKGGGGLQQSNSIWLLVKIKLKQNQNNWSGNWS